MSPFDEMHTERFEECTFPDSGSPSHGYAEAFFPLYFLKDAPGDRPVLGAATFRHGEEPRQRRSLPFAKEAGSLFDPLVIPVCVHVATTPTLLPQGAF
jgi:hypothetical protein